MWDFDICFKAKTSFVGDKICFTLPKVPAPKVYIISYFDMSWGYFVVDKCLELIFLDLVWWIVCDWRYYLCGCLG